MTTSVADGCPSASGADGDLAGLPPEIVAAVVALRQATDVLTGVEPTSVGGRGAMALAAELARAASRLTLAKVRVLPVIDADGLWALGGVRSFPVWVAQQHDVGVHTARTQVRLARTLRDSLPATAAAAAVGDITVEHVHLLAAYAPTTQQRREVLGDPEAACNEQFLVEQARTLPVDQFRVLVRQWAAYADPDADDRGYVEAADREHLELHRLGDGYHLRGQLTVEHGQGLKAALECVTPVPAVGDVRSAAQRRAQALADLARITLDHGLAGTGRAVRPRVSVLVDHATFAALADAALADVALHNRATTHRTTADGATHGSAGQVGDAPAVVRLHRTRHEGTLTRTPPVLTPELLTGQAIAGGPQFEDGTPIPRALLDRIACDSEIKRIVFGPASEVLDVGRSRRTFTRAQRAAIVARDKHCRYPGCTAPAAISEGHHVRHWARDHGDTSVDNGILLCWYHHDLVHRRRLDIRRRGDAWIFADARGTPIDPGADRLRAPG